MADSAADGPAYQVAPQIQQLQAERVNAEAYGNTDRVASIDKTLEGLGVKAEQRKAAGEQRKAASDDSDDADESKKRSTPPQGRSAKPMQKS